MKPILENTYIDGSTLSLFDIHSAPKLNEGFSQGFFPSHSLIYRSSSEQNSRKRVNFQIIGTNFNLFRNDPEEIYQLLSAFSILIDIKILDNPIRIYDYELDVVLNGFKKYLYRNKVKIPNKSRNF